MGSGFFYFRLTTFYMTKYLAIAFLITGFPKCNGWGKVGELVTRTEKSRCGNFHNSIWFRKTFKCFGAWWQEQTRNFGLGAWG